MSRRNLSCPPERCPPRCFPCDCGLWQPYMCPEMMQEREICTKADAWAAGVVAYEILHGQVPSWWVSLPDLSSGLALCLSPVCVCKCFSPQVLLSRATQRGFLVDCSTTMPCPCPESLTQPHTTATREGRTTHETACLHTPSAWERVLPRKHRHRACVFRSPIRPHLSGSGTSRDSPLPASLYRNSCYLTLFHGLMRRDMSTHMHVHIRQMMIRSHYFDIITGNPRGVVREPGGHQTQTLGPRRGRTVQLNSRRAT